MTVSFIPVDYNLMKRAETLTKSAYRPPQIRHLQEKIACRKSNLELQASISGTVSPADIQEVALMMHELDNLYGLWLADKL